MQRCSLGRCIPLRVYSLTQPVRMLQGQGNVAALSSGDCRYNFVPWQPISHYKKATKFGFSFTTSQHSIQTPNYRYAAVTHFPCFHPPLHRSPRLSIHEPDYDMSVPFTTSVIASTTPCSTCKKPASLKCAACPASDPTWYCSKECQTKGWAEHKPECKEKLFYAHARELKWPNEYPKINGIAFVTGYDLRDEMKGFLREVPVDARMTTIAGDDGVGRVPSPALLAGIAEATRLDPVAYGERALALRSQYNSTPKDEIPVQHRLLTYGSDYSDGRATWEHGIPVYPQDYIKLSYAIFRRQWGMKGIGVVVKNPWLGHATGPDVVTTLVLPGLDEGIMENALEVQQEFRYYLEGRNVLELDVD